MQSEITANNTKDFSKSLLGPWQWYVLIVTGFALTGLFPWLMVSRAFYQRNKRLTAIVSSVINLAIFIFFSLFLLKARIAWWWLISFTYLFNFLWAFAAWLFQRRFLGPAQRRYTIKEWKSWITPLLIGALIGLCIATLFSISYAFENRVKIQETLETLNRETILWDFFKYSPFGLLAGLVLGFWWAGEGKRFQVSHVITFLSALAITFILLILFFYLTDFLIHKGKLFGMHEFALPGWSLYPPWVKGFRKSLLNIQAFDISLLLVVPLLFGAASRFRDFGKRLLILPLILLCVFPLCFVDDGWWKDIQDQIVYEMSSSDRHTSASAHNWAEIMITRYPNHNKWPKIAESLARYYYIEEEYEKSRAFYQSIIDRYRKTNQWYWLVKHARNILKDSDFGKPSYRTELEIPMVDYEEYLTHNWMALLSNIRYWEGSKIPESEVKIRLKDLSISDNKILLSPLDSLADLDDAARSLGYEVFILPADLNKAMALVSMGIPLIHHLYTSFNLIFGFDESRSVLCSYSFRKLSDRLRQKDLKEAKEILSIEEEGRGESKNRLIRIANETYCEYAFDYWEDPAIRYMGPLIAIVFPEKKAGEIAKALNTSISALKKESDGYLATLIGLSYIKNANQIQAFKWAKIGAGKTEDPMPLYVAHLAKLFWESRDKKVKSNIQLQDQFPDLARIFTFFKSHENSAFIKKARSCFDTHLNTNILPWIISCNYIPLLDRSNPVDLNLTVKTIKKRIEYNPAYYGYWKFLADTYEWAEDTPGMVYALKGLVSSNPMNFKEKLRLAYGHVLLEQYSDAKEVLDKIDSGEIRYDADYPFCLGAIAQWQGNRKQAMKQYSKAIEMRRYKPIYHLKYGKLLLQEGQHELARKTLKWAIRIDAGEYVKKEAELLLLKMR